jgi:leucyl aminopeptidase
MPRQHYPVTLYPTANSHGEIMWDMKTQLVFANLAAIETEMLAVIAGDVQTAKGAGAKPEPVLFTGDAKLKAAAAAVLASGEFKAGANETLLLHAPAGLAAKRLLIVGVGKTSKATAHSVRSAAGTAIRFAKPRGIRDVAFALPKRRIASRPLLARRIEGACWPTTIPTPTAPIAKTRVSTFTVAAVAGLETPQSSWALPKADHRRKPELRPRAGQRARQQAHPDRPRPARRSHGRHQYGLKAEVYSTEKLHELKMGAFWSVSQGSEEPPALIVLTYEPEGYDAAPTPAQCSASSARASPSTPAASPSSPPTRWS